MTLRPDAVLATPATGPSHAATTVAAAVGGVSPIGLSELMAKAELQSRVDTKFIVFPAVIESLVSSLGTDVEVLEIDGRRQFAYESVYFDTDSWRTYRDHLQGRRHRFKVRTREYVDSGLCMFEIKLEGNAGTTEKLRSRHPLDAAAELTPDAAAMLDRVLAEQGITGEAELRPALRTAYRRTTLVGRHREFRITIDTDLSWSRGGEHRTALQDRALIEVKTASAQDPVLSLVRDLGVRPVSVSKYCAGVALLNPQLPSNPWRPVLREHFAAAA